MSESGTHWNLDRYQQLQLPHPDHPQDGHTDMVYAASLQDDYLDSTPPVPALTGHTGSVIAVNFNAAAINDVIITGDHDGTVRVWRFSTGEAVKTIVEAHTGDVLCLDFDHRYLVTGGKDGKIKLWTRRSLEVNSTDLPGFAARPSNGDKHHEHGLLTTFDGHDGEAVLAPRQLNDGLVSGSGDSSMCISSLETGGILQRVNIHQGGVACLQYNGRFIVSGSTDNTAKIYDIVQDAEIASLEGGHTNLVKSVRSVLGDNGDVHTVVTGSYDGSIRFWEQMPASHEWRTQQQYHIRDFGRHGDVPSKDEENDFSNRISSVDLDAERLVCAGHGPIIRFWDFRLLRK